MTIAQIVLSVLFALLLVALVRIHRVREWHHGYYGFAIAYLALQLHWSLWVAAIGLVLLLDDLVQHVAEAIGRVPRMADFTPIHRIGAWLMGHDWKSEGMWVPVVIMIALFALAVFSALHWGV